MTRRQRLRERAWPAIEAYASRPCDETRAEVDRILLGKRLKPIEVPARAMRLAIVDANGFVGRAAVQLGVSRCTLTRLLRKAGLDEYAREWRHKAGWRYGRPKTKAA